MARAAKFEAFPKSFIVPLVLAFLLTASIVLTNGFQDSQDVRSRAFGDTYNITPTPECSPICSTSQGACKSGSFDSYCAVDGTLQANTCLEQCAPGSTPKPCTCSGTDCKQTCTNLSQSGCNTIYYWSACTGNNMPSSTPRPSPTVNPTINAYCSTYTAKKCPLNCKVITCQGNSAVSYLCREKNLDEAIECQTQL